MNLDILTDEDTLFLLFEFAFLAGEKRDFLAHARKTRLPVLYELRRLHLLRELNSDLQMLNYVMHCFTEVLARIPEGRIGRTEMAALFAGNKAFHMENLGRHLGFLEAIFAEAGG